MSDSTKDDSTAEQPESVQTERGGKRLQEASQQILQPKEKMDDMSSSGQGEEARIEDRVQTLSIDAEASNTITTMPTKDLPSTPLPPDPPAATEKPYVDPTPKTPVPSRKPSMRQSVKRDEDEKQFEPEPTSQQTEQRVVENDMESTSEIQSIMEQFEDQAGAPTKEEIMSPRHEMANPMLGSPNQFPLRKSSLEPLRSRDMDAIAQSPVMPSSSSEKFALSPPPVPPKPDQSQGSLPIPRVPSTASLPTQPPPPEPEPDLPFDFHRFLEQLRHKSADPVAKFLRSFLTEFGKKQWMVHEQVKIIGDFLAFITNKMALCDVWREVSDTEFDNAKEGMEKLVMNRLYSQTFSPVIPPPPPQPARSRSRSRRKELDRNQGVGRRGQHQEDVERDEILAQKIRIYSWVREAHLDISPVGSNGERFLRLAQQELLKIKGYRAPRDKIICILNCCKVIFGLLKNSKSSDTSADSFVPLLIYVVLQSNPEHIVSNVQYILRFRNQEKLGGEAGYYLSSLSGAIQFIENLDRTTLTVSDEEFERNVEIAVSEIAAQNRETEAFSPRTSRYTEKSAIAEPELTPRNSMDVVSSSPRIYPRDSRPGLVTSSSADSDEGVAGLLRTIQRPLTTIGRMFSDTDTTQEKKSGTSSTPQPGSKLSPSMLQPPPRDSGQDYSQQEKGTANQTNKPPNVVSYDAQEAAARQASAEAAEARRIQRAEHRTVVETLCGMFPNLDKEVIDDVVRQKQGRVGLAVDACLALTAGA